MEYQAEKLFFHIHNMLNCNMKIFCIWLPKLILLCNCWSGERCGPLGFFSVLNFTINFISIWLFKDDMEKVKGGARSNMVFIQGKYVPIKPKQAEDVVLPYMDCANRAYSNEDRSIKNGLHFFSFHFFCS